MKSVGLVILGVLGFGAFITLVTVGGNALGFWQYSVFAPKYAAMQNQVFHNSQQYNDGMIRDLENIKREYQSADANGKAALKATAIHRFEIYPRDRMTPDLQAFYDSLNQ